MLTEDHAAIPIITRIKAMVMAAAIQYHQEGNQTLSTSRTTANRQPSGRDRGQGSQQRDGDARSSINHNRDECNVIDGRRHEWEEEEQHWRNDNRERFG